MANVSSLVAYAARQGVRADTVIRKAIGETSKRVILRTPVDTGRARANWQATIGAPASGEVNAVGAQAAIAQAESAAAQAPGQVFWLVNNLPYINRLEFEGWSRQAPAGMLRVSVAEFQAQIERAIRSSR